jgi:hypothetical protein
VRLNAPKVPKPRTEARPGYPETPSLDVGMMFTKVRDQVLARSTMPSEPFTYGLLPGQEFYFEWLPGRDGQGGRIRRSV